MTMNKYLSKITLNVNGLNAPIKRHRIAEWIRYHDPHIWWLQGTHFSTKTYTDWKWRAGTKHFKQMPRKKKARVAILISDKTDFKKRGHKKRQRRSLHNTQGKNPGRRHKHCKYICTQHRSTQIHKENLEGHQERYWQQHNYTGDFNSPLSKIDRPSKQNINTNTVALNNILDQMALTDIHIELLIPKTQNTHSFQMHMGHFQR